MLSRAKRGTSRINASKSARWLASMGLVAGRKAISTPGAFFRGSRSKSGKVGMPDPQAVNTLNGRYGIGIGHAFSGLYLAKKGGELIGGFQLVGDGAGAIAIMRHLQSDSALAG